MAKAWKRKYRFRVECPVGCPKVHYGLGNTETAARRRLNDCCDFKGERIVIDWGGDQ